VRFQGLILAFIGIFLFCSPARAGKLMYWQFVPLQNRLTFTTNDGVQPQAQLLNNPTRLVIDLPDTTLESQTAKENYGQAVRSLRVGQFDDRTTRLVLEIAPGYTLDPKQIEFKGDSPTKWSVNLPKPTREPIIPTNSSPLTSSAIDLSVPVPKNSDRAGLAGSENDPASPVRVTRNGIFVNINGNNTNKVKVTRSSDRNTIDLELENVTLPRELASQTLPVNSYGIGGIQFSQTANDPPVARLSLQVDSDSPDWIASFSRFGGLVIVPKGGLGSISSDIASNSDSDSSFSSSSDRSPSFNSGSSIGSRSIEVPSSSRFPLSDRAAWTESNRNKRDRFSRMGQATVESVQLRNNGQLLIKSDRNAIANGNWNSAAGVYEIRIANAKLADSFTGPQFQANSPISELRVRQEDDSILLLMRPALGVRFGQLDRLSGDMLALGIEQTATARNLPGLDLLVPPVGAKTPLPSDRPLPALFPKASVTPNTLAQKRQSGILVVIDAGHGGKDPGAIGRNDLWEKGIVLDVSQQINKILEKKGVGVLMTRTNDTFVSLEGRTNMANKANADLFVSIHANAISLSRPDVNGVQNYYYKNGKELAETVHRNILRNVNIPDRGVHKARFYVLRHSDMPSILVELGYVTGADDAVKLKDPSFRRKMAEAIANGIIEYIQKRKS
jgi:N-acetylmuramoyl-L-alanine amidase